MREFENVGPGQVRTSKALERFFVRNLKDVDLLYDHGCGYGAWTDYLSQLAGAQAAIFDPDADAYAHTRSVLGSRFSDSEGPYDAILCFAVLELFDEARQLELLREFAANLRGRRLLVQYNIYNPLALRWLAIRLTRGNPIEWHENSRFHRSYLKRSQVEALFRKAGFSIVEKCHPFLENHLPFALNSLFGPIVPSALHMTFFYALEKA